MCSLVGANRIRDLGCSKHPGLSCALCLKRGQAKKQSSGETRRENAKLYRCHCELQIAVSTMAAELPFWSEGCAPWPVVPRSTPCSPHLLIERHVRRIELAFRP